MGFSRLNIGVMGLLSLDILDVGNSIQSARSRRSPDRGKS